jgi:two-component system, chemotaxis family, chemotaxis protein CheY
MKVLVVDDDQAVRATLVEFIEGFGHAVVEATSAEEGLRKLFEEGADFIISDWNMSGMTGVEFLTAVRADPKSKDIPFIIVTSPESNEILKIQAAVGARVDSYIVKPFRGETLESKIKEVLSKKGIAPVAKNGVLVVDDDDHARAIIVEIVRVLGHQPIFQAKDGAEAFDLLKVHVNEIGLVISDWEMPKLTGNELLRKIRADREFANLPFLMVTSQTSMEQLKLAEAISAQVNHYLMKPFTIKKLEEKIGIVLSKAITASKARQQLNEAKEAYQKGQTSEARALYRKILKADKKNVPALLELADTYLHDGISASFDEAVRLMKKAIQIAPKADSAYIALALTFERGKSLDGAIRFLQDAAKQIPASANIQYHLGRLTLKRGHADQAVTYLEQALKLNPDLKETLTLLEEAKKKELKKESK